ncbi:MULTISPECIES: PTS sugar transporter subunit IIA [unclassified Enterococcus]|uniref:PTS sugar transporter subunit IIA n=1 Tax=unclassified Enterococcus TaxID=2608891 RepID=UPI0013EB38AB|nr:MULTISPECIES: PTS sugar transporter subunit IIA [unclassified Enterococcus]
MIELPKERILLDRSFQNWEDALRKIGEWMVVKGNVTPDYIQSMIDRQKRMSVYIGNFVALPHAEGTDESVIEEGIFLIQVPDGINFGTKDEPKIATILFAAALKKEHQLSVLQELAFFCSDIDQVMALSDANTVEEIQMIFAQAHT